MLTANEKNNEKLLGITDLCPDKLTRKILNQAVSQF
jgi:hypothetical protein